jgi:hypothetical protein
MTSTSTRAIAPPLVRAAEPGRSEGTPTGRSLMYSGTPGPGHTERSCSVSKCSTLQRAYRYARHASSSANAGAISAVVNVLSHPAGQVDTGLRSSRNSLSMIFGRTLNKITRWPRHVATRTSTKNPHTTSMDVTSGTVH